jgi:MipA family protein
MKSLRRRVLVAAGFLALLPLAQAQSVPDDGERADTTIQSTGAVPPTSRPLPDEKSWRLGVGLGYGMRTNPLIQSDDIPVVVDIDIAWFGKRWFFDNGDLGFALLDNRLFTANLVARVNSDRTFFSKTNTRFVSFALASNGVAVPIIDPATGEPAPSPQPTALKVPKRDYAVELGFEMLFGGEWGEAALHGFRDASNTHDGFELAADYSYRWTRGRLSLSPSLGIAYKSARLSNYYWGVHPDEAALTLRGYRADAGLNWEAGLRANYYLSKNLRAAISANYERLHDSIAQSPIVERPYVFGYFAGVAWQF